MKNQTSVQGWTRKELLSLPMRDWKGDQKRYDSILILSDGTKHDSGWGCITIIGCINHVPIEICSSCSDNISWIIDQPTEYSGAGMRTDCAMPSRAMHFWCAKGGGRFQVGMALSSIDIRFCSEQRS